MPIMCRLLAVICVLISFSALADTPPPYLPFEIKSENSRFVAKVDVADRMGKTSPWEWKYRLKVFNVSVMSKLLWESEYLFDGYPQGALSDDGRYFVYVNSWFFDNAAILYIYKEGSIKKYSAKDLNVSSTGLRRTASHKLWLKDGGGFRPESGTPTKFIINTEQGERSIDL